MSDTDRSHDRLGEVFSRREVALLAQTPQGVADRALSDRVLTGRADRSRRPVLRLLPEFAVPLVAAIGGLKLNLATPIRRRLASTLAELDLHALAETHFEIEPGVWLDLSLLAYPAARRARLYRELRPQVVEVSAHSDLNDELAWARALYQAAHTLR